MPALPGIIEWRATKMERKVNSFGLSYHAELQ
jgi:hypothetical protein